MGYPLHQVQPDTKSGPIPGPARDSLAPFSSQVMPIPYEKDKQLTTHTIMC
jgi:hypothetical protein